MASMLSEDENSDGAFSDYSLSSRYSLCCDDELRSKFTIPQKETNVPQNNTTNLAINLHNRQIYGRFTKHSKARTEQAFSNVHRKCRYPLSSLIKDRESLQHVYMGFTRCGRYFLSYTEKFLDDSVNLMQHQFVTIVYEYELYIWRFVPGSSLKLVSKHRIFKHVSDATMALDVTFMQYPNDVHKLVCSGISSGCSEIQYITILTLPCPPRNCRHCHILPEPKDDTILSQGWCTKHGFILHYMFPITTQLPATSPPLEPTTAMCYPDYLVINVGHHIHILNVTTLDPCSVTTTANNQSASTSEDASSSSSTNNLSSMLKQHASTSAAATVVSSSVFSDNVSEVSESISEQFGSVVDAILEDFNEYDLESSDASKPFHELNISCEPLNVTGKSYHNAIVQNVFDTRAKRVAPTVNNSGGGGRDYVFSVPSSTSTASQKASAGSANGGSASYSLQGTTSNASSATNSAAEKSKIDKKTAEKAYEFIEENEKYEKISLFRKKRLAEKKYEFSEDNSENIVPFNSLRRERRFINRCIRSSPDFNSLFLSPKSSAGLRSPMQSPNSRCGQFSPCSNLRNIYTSLTLRNSPHHSKSPISPRESARKFYVYSPSMDSDCSDSDSRLVMRTSNSSHYFPSSSSHHVINGDSNRLLLAQQPSNSGGLLIVDPQTMIDRPKWIKKVVRRYTNGDFENSSLVSGQSRDDFNIPIEIPLLVQGLTEQQFDIVPEFKADYVTEMQLLATQRSFDCDFFIQKRAQNLCAEHQLEFLHCGDYDIKVIHVCPLNGYILCQAVIKIGALKNYVLENFTAHCLFAWNIVTDEFDIIEPNRHKRIVPSNEYEEHHLPSIPKIYVEPVLILDSNLCRSKTVLRDSRGFFEVTLSVPNRSWRLRQFAVTGAGTISSGSDSDSDEMDSDS